MCCTEECMIIVAVVIQLLFSLFNIGMAIAEAVILSKNTGAKSECGNATWACILCLCIIRFLTLLTTTSYKYSSNDENDNSTRKYYRKQSACIYMAFAVWAMVCYYGTDSDCVEVYKHLYPDLWTILFVEVIAFYVFMGIVVIAVPVLVYCILVKSNGSTHTSTIDTQLKSIFIK